MGRTAAGDTATLSRSPRSASSAYGSLQSIHDVLLPLVLRQPSRVLTRCRPRSERPKRVICKAGVDGPIAFEGRVEISPFHEFPIQLPH